MKIPVISKFIDKNARSIANDYISAFLKGEDIDFSSFAKAGVPVTQETALHTSVFWACVKNISEDIATLPCHLYRQRQKGKDYAIGHKLYPILLSIPNNEMTSVDFWQSMVLNAILWGVGYAEIVRNIHEDVVSLTPLLSQYMTISRDQSGNLNYRYTASGQEKTYKDSQLFKITGMSLNGINGLSVIQYAKESLGLTQATETFGASYFGSGAKVDGILSAPAGIVVENKDEIRKQWENEHQGPVRRHRISVLDQGIEYKQIGLPPEDSQFLETRQFQITEVCRWFRMPPHKIQHLLNATFSNIEHQSIEYVVDCLRPWIVRIEKAISRCLLKPQEVSRYYAKFNVDALLRGDYKARMEGHAIAKNNGILSSNEIRDVEDWNPIPDGQGGDTYMVNGNYIPMGMVGTQYDKKGGETIGQGKDNQDDGDTDDSDEGTPSEE